VLRLNNGAAPEKYVAMRDVCGLAPDTDLAAAMADLNATIGLPADLKRFALPADIVAPMAALAMADHSTPTNPRPLAQADYEALLTALI
jgi:alcohol dehydrogenase class IV